MNIFYNIQNEEFKLYKILLEYKMKWFSLLILFVSSVYACPLLDPKDVHLCTTHYPKAIQNIREKLDSFESQTSLSISEAAEAAIGTERTFSIRIENSKTTYVGNEHPDGRNIYNNYHHIFTKLPDQVITFNLLDEPRVNICPKVPQRLKNHGYHVAKTTEGDISLVEKKFPAIFSLSVVTGCNLDIVIPGLIISNVVKFNRHSHKENQVPWDQKRNELYWRGSSTGMESNLNTYHLNHRIRLAKTNNKYINNIKVNVGISGVIHCGNDCNAISNIGKSEGWVVPSEPLSETLKYKYLVDVDGNADSIQRLPYLMSVAESLIFRGTIFKTWYSDWLIQPWVHYIPIDITYDDLETNMKLVLNNPDIVAPIIKNAKEVSDMWFNDPMPSYYLFWMLHEYGLRYQSK